MSEEGLLLIIDAGSGGAKVFLVDSEGRIVRSSSSPWDRRQWNPEEAWSLVCTAVKNALRFGKVNPQNVVGVSCTGMREEFVLVDKEDRCIQTTMTDDSWRHGEKTLENLGARMYDVSGHWPVPNWIAGSILPWLRQKNQDTLKRIKHLLMTSDWVNYRLTGVAATEGSMACETALYDVRKNLWSWELIDELDLPREMFPDVLQSGEPLGFVTGKASQETGIASGTPVVVGGADTQCGLLGAGAKIDEAVAVGGTTTPIQVLTDEPVFDKKRHTWTNNYLTPSCWTLESNAGYTGRAYSLIREALNRVYSYNDLNIHASETPSGSNGLLAYLGTHVFDAGPPYWENDRLGDIDVPRTLVGRDSYSVGELARSVIESNCYGVRANIEQIERVSGAKLTYLKFCGGDSRSRLWAQTQADVLGVPVIVPSCVEATALGAAICSAVGAGFYNGFDEAVEAMVRLRDPLHPDRGNHATYERLYQKWLKVRECLPGML